MRVCGINYANSYKTPFQASVSVKGDTTGLTEETLEEWKYLGSLIGNDQDQIVVNLGEEKLVREYFGTNSPMKYRPVSVAYSIYGEVGNYLAENSARTSNYKPDKIYSIVTDFLNSLVPKRNKKKIKR